MKHQYFFIKLKHRSTSCLGEILYLIMFLAKFIGLVFTFLVESTAKELPSCILDSVNFPNLHILPPQIQDELVGMVWKTNHLVAESHKCINGELEFLPFVSPYRICCGVREDSILTLQNHPLRHHLSGMSGWLSWFSYCL